MLLTEGLGKVKAKRPSTIFRINYWDSHYKLRIFGVHIFHEEELDARIGMHLKMYASTKKMSEKIKLTRKTLACFQDISSNVKHSNNETDF